MVTASGLSMIPITAIATGNQKDNRRIVAKMAMPAVATASFGAAGLSIGVTVADA